MNINLNPSISPLQQGDLDSLCGIYAIINAIRLAAGTTITKPTEKNLSYRGVRVLLEREVLGATLQNGLGAKNFRRLSKEIVKKACQLTGLSFRTNRFDEAHKTPEDFFKHELLAGRPTCLRITGYIDHYTVLSGITPTKLILFDSVGLSWVKRSSFFPAVPDMPARYGVDPRTIFSICLESGENKDDLFFDELDSRDLNRLWEIE